MFYKTTTKINDESNYCFCSSDNNTPKLRIWLTSQLSNVKTIIFVGYEGNSFTKVDFKVQVSNSKTSGYSEICGYGACQFGSNDFSASPLTFKYMEIIWPANKKLQLCNIYIYDQYDWVRQSTITFALPNNNANSYDIT